MAGIYGIHPEKTPRTAANVTTPEEAMEFILGPVRKRMGEGANSGGSPGGPGGPTGRPGKGLDAPHALAKAALHIKNGAITTSAVDMVYGGSYDGSSAKDLRIVTYDENVGGVCAEGNGTRYTVENAAISIAAAGTGFGGIRSGACAKDGADLTIKNSIIVTSGESRSATGAEGGGILRVYDSVLISQGAPFGEDAPADRAGKTSPPAPLEILGNVRTHCTSARGMSYFYNSTLVSDGWAVLSTDHSEGYAYLEATDCVVKATKDGYGTYADKFCHCVLRRCNFDVAVMAAILDGEASIACYDSEFKCGKYFALIHATGGPATQTGDMTVENCSVVCGDDVFSMRGHNIQLNLRNSSFTTKPGKRFLHSRANQDSQAPVVDGQAVYGYNILLEGSVVTGDVIHEDNEREMYLTLKSATLSGVIQGAHLSLNEGSKWFATGDSTVTLFDCQLSAAQLDAPEGVTITARAAESGSFTLKSGGRLLLIAQPEQPPQRSTNSGRPARGPGGPRGEASFVEGPSTDGKTLRIDFNHFGKQCGIIPRQIPAENGVPAHEQIEWDLEHALLALKKITELSEQYETLEFQGHPDHWLMAAMVDQKAPTCTMMNNIPIFPRPYPLIALTTGTTPDNSSMTFELVEHCGDLLVLGTLHHKGSPEDNLALIVPEIPENRNVYVKLVGEPSPIFIPVGISEAYALKCRALFIGERDGDAFRCAITHTSEYSVGQVVSSPFSR